MDQSSSGHSHVEHRRRSDHSDGRLSDDGKEKRRENRSMRNTMRRSARRPSLVQQIEETKGAKPIFADAEAMKEKLRRNMERPQYDVSNFYYEEGLWQFIARHSIFERLTLFVILLNAIYISIDTDHNHSAVLLQAPWPFQLMEHFFCFYFTMEWFVRFMSFRRKRDGCRDAWFVFDSVMVVIMVAETWVLTLSMALLGAGSGSGMGNAGIMRLLRLLRLSRMARMARLLSAMPELLILIKGMVSAMRSVFFTLLLQGIILYVFGITFTQLTADSRVGIERFRDVPTSMHTLLICGTLMDNIGELVRELGESGAIYPMVFYLFVLISALTVMNMLIGVLCEVVSAVAATEREELTVSYVQARIKEILRQGGLDQDGDGLISKVEFAQILENPSAARILAEVGVDVFGLVELSDFIFQTETEDGEVCVEGQLTFGDFMEIILQLRGTNNATVKDIVDLRKFMSKKFRGVEIKIKSLEDKMTFLIQQTLQQTLRQVDISLGVKQVDINLGVRGSKLQASSCNESFRPEKPYYEEIEATPFESESSPSQASGKKVRAIVGGDLELGHRAVDIAPYDSFEEVPIIPNEDETTTLCFLSPPVHKIPDSGGTMADMDLALLSAKVGDNQDPDLLLGNGSISTCLPRGSEPDFLANGSAQATVVSHDSHVADQGNSSQNYL